MFKTLLETLLVGLKLWNTKESRKYIDRAMQLERDYYEEDNKPRGERSNAVLDHIERELRILAIAFTSEAGKPEAGNQPGPGGV